MTWTCRLCQGTFTVPPGRDPAVYQAGHLYGRHRCTAVYQYPRDRHHQRIPGPRRCLLVGPHRYRHHVFTTPEEDTHR